MIGNVGTELNTERPRYVFLCNVGREWCLQDSGHPCGRFLQIWRHLAYLL